MVDKSELLRVPAFADLPDDQLDWFISQAQEMKLKAGEVYSRQGDPADAMFVILEGRLQGRGELAGENVVFDLEAGDVTGVLPFSRMKTFTVGGRAETDSRALRFSASLFPELIQKMPALTQRLVGLMSDRIREVTRLEQQQDRLASLGKLSAGLAHELNNPAAAMVRTVQSLRSAISRVSLLGMKYDCRFDAAQRPVLEELQKFAREHASDPEALSPLDRSDREEAMADWLEENGVAN